jgi:hypothetical protein
MRTIILLLMMTAFANAEVVFKSESFSAVIAKSAKVEQRADTVAVFLTGRQEGEQTGAHLTITSDYKFVTPYTAEAGVVIEPSKTTKSLYFLYAPPGTYKILLIESDPDKGLKLSNAESVVDGVKPPVVLPPVAGDFAALTKAVKDNAARLKDPRTQSELKIAYADVIPLLAGKSYEECKATITAARFFVFNQRQGPSRLVDWDSWRTAVDAELVKVVKAGDAAGYIKAMTAIINAL